MFNIAYCTGELKILNLPKVVTFNDAKFSGNNAGQLFQACMGYSTYVTDQAEKKFLTVASPFGLAEYAITLRITGVPSIGSNLKTATTVTLTGDEVSIDSLKTAIAAEDNSMSAINLNSGIEAVSLFLSYKKSGVDSYWKYQHTIYIEWEHFSVVFVAN